VAPERRDAHMSGCASLLPVIAPVVDRSMPADDIAIKVHRDHDVGTKRTADGHGYGLTSSSIHEPAITMPSRAYAR
jgi:hypothetical protein